MGRRYHIDCRVTRLPFHLEKVSKVLADSKSTTLLYAELVLSTRTINFKGNP